MVVNLKKNKMEIKNKIPYTGQQLQDNIDAYFDECRENKEVYTFEGLANAIGADVDVFKYKNSSQMVDTLSLMQERDKYAVRKAIHDVFIYLSKHLIKNNKTGTKFYLGQYGYYNNQDEIDNSEKKLYGGRLNPLTDKELALQRKILQEKALQLDEEGGDDELGT